LTAAAVEPTLTPAGNGRERRPVLDIQNVSLNFGGVAALRDVSLTVRDGEIFALIGPNGAGKTVLLNSINGLYKPQHGRIFFAGQDISDLRPHQRAGLGIARTFQKIELFSGMTVLDNIRLGPASAHAGRRAGRSSLYGAGGPRGDRTSGVHRARDY